MLFGTQEHTKTFSKTNIIIYFLQILKHFGLSNRKPSMISRKKSIKASKKFADELQLKLLIENKTSLILNELKPK